MTEYLQVWRARVADADVERLLAVRPVAIAEAQHLCPQLLRADLVRLDDVVWLDVLTWSCADGEERLMARAEEFDAVATRSLLRTRKRFVETSVEAPEQFAAFLDAGLADADPTMDEVDYRLLCEEVRISCTYGMLLCVPRPQRAAYLLADVIGLTDVEGAAILECSREAFRQRVSRARRTLRHVIDNRCGLVGPANPRRCGRQMAAGEQAGILRRDDLPLAEHAREEPRVWLEPVAKQLDDVTAIGELYRFDRFAAPATLRDELQQRFPALLG